ncbi:hypothetical protein Tco_0858318 [Tanacetum coccineum]|uniref:Uncharacterized protein n=1 Tax=Tanacetum coccineum TaxID=301880 RepID=A0ABQ5B9I5_9ASTR
MKEMLHQRMFKTGSYKLLPEHITLYKALKASMERAQGDEFLAEKDKSRKRQRDDQDPPPPPPDLDQIDDIPIQDSDNISDSEDTDSAHLPKTKQRPEWLKPIPDDERPATLELVWVIPTSHIPDVVNNWANAFATTYQALAENSLLEKTRDMRTFMNWYCQKMGKTELTQEYLEGQAYKVVKPFYPDVIHLQFQMEECHKMLTNQIDWANPEGDQVMIDISKPLPLSGPLGHMKAARYHDFGLELLVPKHMWIDDVCTVPLMVVKTHMYILSVVRIKAYSRYGYDYLKEITLRIAAHQEYTIAKKDFKNLYPSNFEDLNLLLLQVIRQRVEDFQLGTESYWKQLNLTKPGWDATGFEFKHDYTIIDSPRAVTRGSFENLECFVGGRVADIELSLLQRTDDIFTIHFISQNQRDLPRDNPLVSVEVLRYDIKRSKCENKGIVPTEMELELEQTQQGSSHEVSVQVKMEMEMEIPRSSGVYFRTACSYSTDTSNDLMKAQVYVSKLPQL